MKYKCAHIDFESRSTVDLEKAGVYVYASHPTTDILCLAYAFDDGPIKLWRFGDPPPLDLLEEIHKGITIIAHNATFEYIMWNFVCHKKYGWPTLKLENCNCTMIRAYAMGLPGTLEKASKSVGLKAEKDMKGHRIMLQLSQPRYYNSIGGPIWWDINDTDSKHDIKAKYEHLYKYCKQDIIVERELDKRLLPLTDSELKLWYLDQKINYRGVYFDLNAASNAIEIVKIEKKRLNEEMQRATRNKVATCNAAIALKAWINSFDIYKGKKYKEDGPVITYKLDGKTLRRKQWHKGDLMICQSVGKAELFDMLDMKIPKKIKDVLKIRQEAAKSSIAKLDAMIDGASRDNRIRGCFQFYGAASTGRWAGRRVQLHNMTRPTIPQKDIEDIIAELNSNNYPHEIIDNISIFYGPVMSRVSDCLRGILKAAPGKKLIAVDFSAIEGRVLAWLAGEETKLNIYRGHGKIYEYTASKIYNITNIANVTKDQRQIGKVAELALGFQGGVVAFQSMAKNYFVKIPDKQANEIKIAWRKDNPAIVSYWYDIERAAIAAVKYPGQKFACGPDGRKVTFLQRGSFLFCRLPSARVICYPYPKMKIVKTPWGEMKNAMTYKGEENYQFVTKIAYGGLISENVTQATSRDLLAESMIRFEKHNYKIIMHCHDEVTCEVDINFGSVKEACDIMSENPIWAKGLPLNAEGWSGLRYKK